MKLKVISASLVAGLVVISFTGCGQKETASVSPGEPQKNPPAKTAGSLLK
jgi:hypothetical protein